MSLILLAGGKSSRINTDKAFLKFKDKTIIENTINALKNIFDEIIIVANNNLERYNSIIKKYNKTITLKIDLIKNKGPLGGIYTGLKTAKDSNNFILACDMPFINADLIKYMLKFNDFDAVVPRVNDKIEPLYAVYNKNIIPIIEKQIKNNNLKIRDAIKKLKKTKYIGKEEIEKFDKEGICFLNINNYEDLERAKGLIENKKEKYVKICSQCGSTHIKIPPAGMDIRMTMPDYCTKCGNRGIFPEVKEDKIEEFGHDLEKSKKK